MCGEQFCQCGQDPSGSNPVTWKWIESRSNLVASANAPLVITFTALPYTVANKGAPPTLDCMLR